MVAVPLDSHPPEHTVKVNRKVALFPDGDPLSGPDADCPFWTMVTVPLNEDAALDVMSQVIVPGPSWSEKVPRHVLDHSAEVGVEVGGCVCVGAAGEELPPQPAWTSATTAMSRATRSDAESDVRIKVFVASGGKLLCHLRQAMSTDLAGSREVLQPDSQSDRGQRASARRLSF